MNKRLKEIRIYFKMTQEKIAKTLNISTRAWQNYENGIRKIPSSLLNSLYEHLGINSQWLFTGEGEMLLKRDEKISEDESIRNIKMVPIIDTRVSAGYPDIANSDNIKGRLYLPNINNHAVAITVKGKSMYPKIKEGAYVIFLPIEYTGDVKHNDIVIVRDEWNDLMIKRYKEMNGKKYLASDNPEYPTIEPNSNYKIIGKVIKIIYEEEP
jgi:phage repressor protein C with HTH and peptisase S24 domain